MFAWIVNVLFPKPLLMLWTSMFSSGFFVCSANCFFVSLKFGVVPDCRVRVSSCLLKSSFLASF